MNNHISLMRDCSAPIVRCKLFGEILFPTLLSVSDMVKLKLPAGSLGGDDLVQVQKPSW